MLITVRDQVSAGKETAYVLRLIFQPADDQAARINTRVVPATSAMAAQVAPLKAATTFRWQAGVINPQGTTIYSSGLIKDSEQREATPSRRKGN